MIDRKVSFSWHVKAVCGLLALMTCPPLQAQIAPAFFGSQTMFTRSGQAARDYDLTEVAPFQASAAVWKNCLSRITTPLILSSLPGDYTIEEALRSCSGEEDRLKATLAAKVGLPRARAVVALARAYERFKIVSRFGQATKPPPGTTLLGDWQIAALETGSCLALYKSLNTRGADTSAIITTPEAVFVAIYSSSASFKTGVAADGRAHLVEVRVEDNIGSVRYREETRVVLQAGSGSTGPSAIMVLNSSLQDALKGEVYLSAPALGLRSFFEQVNDVVSAVRSCASRH